MSRVRVTRESSFGYLSPRVITDPSSNFFENEVYSNTRELIREKPVFPRIRVWPWTTQVLVVTDPGHSGQLIINEMFHQLGCNTQHQSNAAKKSHGSAKLGERAAELQAKISNEKAFLKGYQAELKSLKGTSTRSTNTKLHKPAMCLIVSVAMMAKLDIEISETPAAAPTLSTHTDVLWVPYDGSSSRSIGASEIISMGWQWDGFLGRWLAKEQPSMVRQMNPDETGKCGFGDRKGWREISSALMTVWGRDGFARSTPIKMTAVPITGTTPAADAGMLPTPLNDFARSAVLISLHILAISFRREQLTRAWSFLDRTQQIAAAAAYGTA
ncbi:hypothetical protein B0H10DRAFT_1960986 [Mycena sp. CBHHK59/15]|nr:hypothetical protein B0H10DRAFT_1960986 [Mycena sp. CBHHK59/15]